MITPLSIRGGTGVIGRLAVIGDVHGEADLFREALDSVERPEEVRLILLGDLIDRGSDSRGVLDLARGAAERFRDVIILPGNHEQMFWWALRRPDGGWADSFVANGGARTLMEFGLNGEDALPDALAALRGAIPGQVIDRLEGRLPAWHREGSLLFVHAGINPDHDPAAFLSNLGDPDLPPEFFDEAASQLWVRREFYANPRHSGPYLAPGGDPVVVVYGHTRIGARDGEELVERTVEELASWRLPMDASGRGLMSVLEIDGERAWLRVVGECSNRPRFMP